MPLRPNVLQHPRSFASASAHALLAIVALAGSVAAAADLSPPDQTLRNQYPGTPVPGLPVSDAGGSSFRTPPLWGLNASGPPYLHDGRAKSVVEAIALHGGEASAARQRFLQLRPDEVDNLLLFLSSI